MAALVRSMTGDHPARPVLVVSNVRDAGGLARACDLGVPTAIVDHTDYPDRAAFEDALHAAFAAAGTDLIALAGFMRILTHRFIDRWTDRIVNIHPSLLPKYPGLDTHVRAIRSGDAEAGCTVHSVTSNLDAGPILGQARVPVLADDSPTTLAVRVLAAEHELYPRILRGVAGDMAASVASPLPNSDVPR